MKNNKSLATNIVAEDQERQNSMDALLKGLQRFERNISVALDGGTVVEYYEDEDEEEVAVGDEFHYLYDEYNSNQGKSPVSDDFEYYQHLAVKKRSEQLLQERRAISRPAGNSSEHWPVSDSSPSKKDNRSTKANEHFVKLNETQTQTEQVSPMEDRYIILPMKKLVQLQIPESDKGTVVHGMSSADTEIVPYSSLLSAKTVLIDLQEEYNQMTNTPAFIKMKLTPRGGDASPSSPLVKSNHLQVPANLVLKSPLTARTEMDLVQTPPSEEGVLKNPLLKRVASSATIDTIWQEGNSSPLPITNTSTEEEGKDTLLENEQDFYPYSSTDTILDDYFDSLVDEADCIISDYHHHHHSKSKSNEKPTLRVTPFGAGSVRTWSGYGSSSFQDDNESTLGGQVSNNSYSRRMSVASSSTHYSGRSDEYYRRPSDAFSTLSSISEYKAMGEETSKNRKLSSSSSASTATNRTELFRSVRLNETPKNQPVVAQSIKVASTCITVANRNKLREMGVLKKDDHHHHHEDKKKERKKSFYFF